MISKWFDTKPLIEIEGKNVVAVRKVINELVIRGKELGNMGVDKVDAFPGCGT